MPLCDMIAPPVKDEVLQKLNSLARGNDVAYHQYLDLLLCRDFRRTLLCHQAVKLNRNRLRDQLAQLLIASPLTQSNKEPDGAVSFRNQRGPGSLPNFVFEVQTGSRIQAKLSEDPLLKTERDICVTIAGGVSTSGPAEATSGGAATLSDLLRE